MKVALVYPFLHRPGGIEQYLRELAPHLGRSTEVTIVHGDRDPAWLTDDAFHGLRRLRIPFVARPGALATASFTIMSTLRLRRRSFDVVNVHGASGLGGDVITAHSCHRAWFRSSLRALPRFGARWWLKLLNPLHHVTIAIEALQYRRDRRRRVIAVAPSVGAEVVEHYGVDPSRVTVVLTGVDCERFHPHNRTVHRRALIRTYGVPEDNEVLLFVGNEFRRKGLKTSIEALARLQDPTLSLLVVGRDSAKPYQRLAERLGVGDQVVFTGSVADTAPCYGAADIFVLPTEYEAFGLVVAEAMASGLPVVTSKRTGAAHLIEDGESGFLLSDPRDPARLTECLRRLRDPALRERVGGAARARAKEASWECVAEATLEVFREIRAERSGSSPSGS